MIEIVPTAGRNGRFGKCGDRLEFSRTQTQQNRACHHFCQPSKVLPQAAPEAELPFFGRDSKGESDMHLRDLGLPDLS
jgi:hypothetical protein